MQCRLCDCDYLILQDKDVKDFEYGAAGGFDYYRCTQCGLLNIDPIPDHAKLKEAYPESYHAYHEHHTLLARLLKERFWNNKAKRYARYLNQESRVLEIGCSFGDLLWGFKKKGISQVRGIDFNPKAVEKARTRGFEVDPGELETACLPENYFDMIVMENFIEHVYDPVKTLQHCYQLLKTGGYLVGETPNVDAWDFRLFGRHWGGYHAPRHLYLFNTGNLNLLGKKTGFLMVRISNILQPAHWALSIQNLLQESSLKAQLRNGRFFGFAPLLLAAIPLNLVQLLVSRTSSVEFVFRKELLAR